VEANRAARNAKAATGSLHFMAGSPIG